VVFAASLITLSTDPSKIPWVLAIFAITQQVEGDVILPLVMKGGAQLPVVPLLIFMLFLGSFFGIIGVFIAPPLLAVLRTLYIDIYLPYVNSQADINKFRRPIK
jgi:predicted PurR-regulated permease PerM